MWILGIQFVAFGVVGLLTGGNDFSTEAFSGDVDGEVFIGVEANGWTNALFVGNGAVLILASATRFFARLSAVVVGLDFGGAAIVAFLDGSDVLGIFATNQATRVVWAVLAVGLLLLALAVPRQTRR